MYLFTLLGRDVLQKATKYCNILDSFISQEPIFALLQMYSGYMLLPHYKQMT